MEIEEFLNETDNMKIEDNVIYHKDDTAVKCSDTARLCYIIHYNNMNNIKKMANKINDNEKKLKNIENYCKCISLFLIIYSITNIFF
jgi:hypothetical protein